MFRSHGTGGEPVQKAAKLCFPYDLLGYWDNLDQSRTPLELFTPPRRFCFATVGGTERQAGKLKSFVSLIVYFTIDQSGPIPHPP